MPRGARRPGRRSPAPRRRGGPNPRRPPPGARHRAPRPRGGRLVRLRASRTGPDEDDGALRVGDGGQRDGADQIAPQGAESARSDDQQIRGLRQFGEQPGRFPGRRLRADGQVREVRRQFGGGLVEDLLGVAAGRASLSSGTTSWSRALSATCTCTSWSGAPRAVASRAAQRTAAVLSGVPSVPAVTKWAMFAPRPENSIPRIPDVSRFPRSRWTVHRRRTQQSDCRGSLDGALIPAEAPPDAPSGVAAADVQRPRWRQPHRDPCASADGRDRPTP